MQNSTLNGTITKIFTHDKNTGFSILGIKASDDKTKKIISKYSNSHFITVIGTNFSSEVGQKITCDGYFKKTEKFGFQFCANSIINSNSLTSNFTKDVIMSDLFKFINIDERKRIIEKYGENALIILSTSPEVLIADKIASAKTCESIKKYIPKLTRLINSFNYLRKIGLSQSAAYKTLEAYGTRSSQIISTNPYELLSLPSIGFKTIDIIANNIGMPLTSQVRLEHCLDYLAQNQLERGNTGFSVLEMAEKASKELSISPEIILNYFRNKVKNGNYTVFKNKELTIMIAPYKIHRQEKLCAKEIIRILNQNNCHINKDELEIESKLNNEQKNAISMSLIKPLSIITGGPGVGKTTVINNVIKNLKSVLNQKEDDILLAAPTGMAAKRMAEATGLKAVTIHTLLGCNEENSFTKNQINKLKAKTIIIDELSMVDINLFYSLLLAIDNNTKVILAGDADQLPSVGPGAILRDMINCGKIPFETLTKVNRVKNKNSLIIENAHLINNKKMPIIKNTEDSDFFFIKADSDQEILDSIKLITKALPEKFDINMNNIQILSPQKETLCGVNKLNENLKEIINPKTNKNNFEIKSFGNSYRVNDKIIQTKNDKSLGLNNGDIGIIKEINAKNQMIKIQFDEKQKDIPIKSMNNMKLAFATTIHKSQGSEFDAVIIPISKSHSRMLSKELIYTGMTRGKKKVFFVGDIEAINVAIKNTFKQKRITFLDKAIDIEFDKIKENNNVSTYSGYAYA